MKTCKILIKNSKPFGEKLRKPQGVNLFDSHNICRALSTDLRHRPIVAPSTDASMAQQSVDGAARSVDGQRTERSVLSTSLTVGSLFDVSSKNNAYLNFLYDV